MAEAVEGLLSLKEEVPILMESLKHLMLLEKC
jgi:hypothetical protein